MRIRLRTLLGLVLAIALALAFYSSFMLTLPGTGPAG